MIDSLGSKIQIHRIGPLKIGKIDFSRKPLEQEPCGKDINVPATDYISRQAVKELFQEACEMEMYEFLGIDDIPSVTPQESVLDKIRAEMFEEMLSHSGTGEEVIQAYADGLKKGLEFIDKYKAESEGKE